jgi:hypothetical protein
MSAKKEQQQIRRRSEYAQSYPRESGARAPQSSSILLRDLVGGCIVANCSPLHYYTTTCLLSLTNVRAFFILTQMMMISSACLRSVTHYPLSRSLSMTTSMSVSCCTRYSSAEAKFQSPTSFQHIKVKKDTIVQMISKTQLQLIYTVHYKIRNDKKAISILSNIFIVIPILLKMIKS